MTPEQIRSIWKKILIPFSFGLLLLVTGLVLRSLQLHSLAAPGAFLCLGGAVGVLLFGFKAIQFILYLRKQQP